MRLVGVGRFRRGRFPFQVLLQNGSQFVHVLGAWKEDKHEKKQVRGCTVFVSNNDRRRVGLGVVLSGTVWGKTAHNWRTVKIVLKPSHHRWNDHPQGQHAGDGAYNSHHFSARSLRIDIPIANRCPCKNFETMSLGCPSKHLAVKDFCFTLAYPVMCQRNRMWTRKKHMVFERGWTCVAGSTWDVYEAKANSETHPGLFSYALTCDNGPPKRRRNAGVVGVCRLPFGVVHGGREENSPNH